MNLWAKLACIRHSFRTKLFCSFAIFIVVVANSFAALYINHEITTYTDRLVVEGELQASLLAQVSRLGVFSESGIMLHKALEDVFANNGHVVRAGIYSSDGRLLLEKSKPGMRTDSNLDASRLAPPKVTFRDAKPIHLKTPDSIIVYAPIIVREEQAADESIFFAESAIPPPGKMLGLVRLVIDTSELNDRITFLVRTGVVLGFGCLLLGLTAAFLLTRGLMRPLRHLQEGVAALERGDLSHPVPVETADEIGQVAIAFNRMATALVQRDRENRLLEEQLRLAQQMEAKKEWELTFDSVPDLVAVLDRDLTILRVNIVAAERLGYSKEQAVGQSYTVLPAGRSELLDYRETLARGIPYSGEIQDLGMGGWFWITLTPMFRSDREVSGAVYVARDITQRRLLEEERQAMQAKLVQTNKMTSLGFLVSGLAHEVNNPNSSIMLASHLLTRAWKDILPILDRYSRDEGDFIVGGHRFSQTRDNLGNHLTGIMDNSRRIEGIIQNLRDFVTSGSSNLSLKFEVNPVIRAAIAMMTSQIKRYTDRFELDLATSLPMIRGNPQQLEQVIVNLVMNALQSLSDRTRVVRISTIDDQDAGQVVIAVRDEGMGMSREVREKAGEPFFSTKIDQGGTGLGIAISRFIVSEHKGTMEIQSSPGNGTTVIIRFASTAGTV